MSDAVSYAVGAPLWLIFCTFAVRTVKDWPNIMARRNEAKRDTASAADALLSRYEHRVAALEAAEEKCRDDLGDALRRIAELEGYNMGRGKARQDAQRMLSEERESDRRGGK